MDVVHDLFAHIYRGADLAEHPLDDLDRPLDTSAEGPRSG